MYSRVYTATLTCSALRMQSMYIKGISVAGMFYPQDLHVYHNKDILWKQAEDYDLNTTIITENTQLSYMYQLLLTIKQCKGITDKKTSKLKYLTCLVSGCGFTKAVQRTTADVTWWTWWICPFHHGVSAKWKILKVARNQMTLHVIRNPLLAWPITANINNDRSGFTC